MSLPFELKKILFFDSLFTSPFKYKRSNAKTHTCTTTASVVTSYNLIPKNKGISEKE